MLPRFFFIIVIYLFFFWFQFTIIFPIETNFNEFVGIVSLIYLPHAVRIISFFVIGSLAFIPIFIAEFLCHIILHTQQLLSKEDLLWFHFYNLDEHMTFLIQVFDYFYKNSIS